MTLHPFMRPAWAEIDLGALARNVRRVREIVGPDVRFYAVCKNNAYGCGAAECAVTMRDAGADAFAVSDPEDAERIRAAGVDAPILLYGAAAPDQAAAIAELDLIVTIHDWSGLEAFERLQRPLQVHVEVDCGYGRLGFMPADWPEVFARLAAASHLEVVGLYTHLVKVEDRGAVECQARRLQLAVAQARAAGFNELEIMAASSRTLVDYPELNFTAVNPGRILYGMMDTPGHRGSVSEPVIRSIKSRVLQVKSVPDGFLSVDSRPEDRRALLRTAVIAFGFKDGLPSEPAGGVVLVRGQRAPILGTRATEHCIIDVTNIPGVEPGDEVVVVGSQGAHEITPTEAAQLYGLPIIELLARMSLSVPRCYSGGA